MTIEVDDPKRNAVLGDATSLASSSVDAAAPFDADILEKNSDVPPFSLENERYDQATYYGRFRKMVDVVDPRTLFYSQRQIDDAVNLLKDFEAQQQKSDGNNSSEDAIFHPDTNEMLPKICRMSGWLVRIDYVSNRLFIPSVNS